MERATAVKRLTREFRDLCNNAPDGIVAGPVSKDDFFTWEAYIRGPADTPYECGVFRAVLTFPSSYPMQPVSKAKSSLFQLASV